MRWNWTCVRGLTVLTGETGAGKSILVDALQLIAGGRAGAEVVRHGAQRAEVTATFELAQAPRELKSWLEDQSISVEQELSVRRVVAADGRSRAYLNGQSVTVQQLREAGNILLDIHGQHEFQTLTRSTGQRDLLDAYGRHEAIVGEVGIAQRVWLKLLNAALELETKARDRDARLSLLRYQAQELTALGLAAGEFTSLTEEATRMANRGRITESVQGALGNLYEEDAGSAHAARRACPAATEGAWRRSIRASRPCCRWWTAPPSRFAKPPGSCSTTWTHRILMRRARIRCKGAWPPSRSWRARTASRRSSCTSAPRSWPRS